MAKVADIRIPVDFWGNRKTRRLVRRLGHEAVCALIRLWCYCAQRRQDGRLEGLTHEDIALEADWSGDADVFVAALLNDGQGGGFLDRDGDVLVCHEWEIHQPWVAGAPERSLKAAELALQRHHKHDPAALEAALAELYASHPAARMRTANDPDASRSENACSLPLPLPLPNPNPLPTPPGAPAGARMDDGDGNGVIVQFGSQEGPQLAEPGERPAAVRGAAPVEVVGWKKAVEAFQGVDSRNHAVVDAYRLDELRGVLLSLDIDGEAFAVEVKAIAKEHEERTGRRLKVTSPHYFQTAIARRRQGGAPAPKADAAPTDFDQAMAKYVRTPRKAAP